MAYTADISYWRINQTNTAIATSALGSGTPDNEIITPLESPGTFSSLSGSGNTTVNGSSTTFNTIGWANGDYLYYINNVGAYILVGQISSISSPTVLILTESPTNTPTSSSKLAASSNLITINEEFYIRVSTRGSGSNVWIPSLLAWRVSNQATASNQPTEISLEAISAIGNPLVNGTATNIPFIFSVMNTWTPEVFPSPIGTRYLAAVKPQYIWLKATPQTAGGLSSKTMYKITADEQFEDINTNPTGVSKAQLNQNGYFNV